MNNTSTLNLNSRFLLTNMLKEIKKKKNDDAEKILKTKQVKNE